MATNAELATEVARLTRELNVARCHSKLLLFFHGMGLGYTNQHFLLFDTAEKQLHARGHCTGEVLLP